MVTRYTCINFYGLVIISVNVHITKFYIGQMNKTNSLTLLHAAHVGL